MLFPACYRPAQVPTMMTGHVDTLTQPNSAHVELAWALLPAYPAQCARDEEAAQDRLSTHRAYGWPLGPCAGVLLQCSYGQTS